MKFDESEQTKHDPAPARSVLLQRLVLRGRLGRYVMAALLAVLWVAARLALEPLWAVNLPLITFYPAIVASALLGGFGLGMTTTLLCAAANYFWMPSARSFAVSEPREIVALVLFVGIGALISAVNHAWRRATDAAAAATERLRTILTSIGDAVIATDTDGRITMMNPVAEALTAWTMPNAA